MYLVLVGDSYTQGYRSLRYKEAVVVVEDGLKKFLGASQGMIGQLSVGE
jgi:hypothetical protein